MKNELTALTDLEWLEFIVRESGRRPNLTIWAAAMIDRNGKGDYHFLHDQPIPKDSKASEMLHRLGDIFSSIEPHGVDRRTVRKEP